MALKQFTAYETSTIMGKCLSATVSTVNSLETKVDSEEMKSYYAGMRAGAELLAKGFVKTMKDLEEVTP